MISCRPRRTQQRARVPVSQLTDEAEGLEQESREQSGGRGLGRRPAAPNVPRRITPRPIASRRIAPAAQPKAPAPAGPAISRSCDLTSARACQNRRAAITSACDRNQSPLRQRRPLSSLPTRPSRLPLPLCLLPPRRPDVRTEPISAGATPVTATFCPGSRSKTDASFW